MPLSINNEQHRHNDQQSLMCVIVVDTGKYFCINESLRNLGNVGVLRRYIRHISRPVIIVDFSTPCKPGKSSIKDTDSIIIDRKTSLRYCDHRRWGTSIVRQSGLSFFSWTKYWFGSMCTFNFIWHKDYSSSDASKFRKNGNSSTRWVNEPMPVLYFCAHY